MSCTTENIDPSLFLKKIMKYLIQGIVVAVVSKWISSQKLSIKEIAIISLSATTSFILLDLYSPSIRIVPKNNN
jgi:hypothetical protein